MNLLDDTRESGLNVVSIADDTERSSSGMSACLLAKCRSHGNHQSRVEVFIISLLGAEI
jgi:hypothetical protein